MRTQTLLALAGAGLLVAACAQKPVAPPPAPPPPPSTGEGQYDLSGQSSSCGTPHIQAITGSQTLTLPLSFINDGGWCALRLQNGGKPFDAGLLPGLPQHGVVFIHKVAAFTRIDYTPNAGFAGTDQFVVKLLPGYLPLTVNVTIAAPHAVVTPAANPSTKP